MTRKTVRKVGRPRKTAGAKKAPYKKREKAPEHEIFLNAAESRALRAIVARLPVEATAARESVFGLAMKLDVGEQMVATGKGVTPGSIGQAIRAAKIAGLLDGREFVYRAAPFAPGVGLASIMVLWVQRVK